eukprot:Rmarinus@m.12922
MSFRGGRGGGGRGGFRGGRGGGRGGFRQFDAGPPSEVVPVAEFMHPCEDTMVYKTTQPKIPYFNAPIYLENIKQIGKIAEIFGPINQVMFSVTPSEGVVPTSFRPGDKIFIDPNKLLPLDRFLPKPKGEKGAGRGRGRGGGPGRGGRGGRGGGGGFRGGRGGGGFRGGRGGGGGGGFRGGRGGGGFRGGRGRGGY